MISARLTPKVNDDSDKSEEIMKLVNDILVPEMNRTGYTFHLNGGPPLNQAFVQIGFWGGLPSKRGNTRLFYLSVMDAGSTSFT